MHRKTLFRARAWTLRARQQGRRFGLAALAIGIAILGIGFSAFRRSSGRHLAADTPLLARFQRRGLVFAVAGTPVLALAFITGTSTFVTRNDRDVRMASMAIEERAALAARADRAERAEVAAPAADTPPAPPPAWVSPEPGIRLSSCFGQRWGAMHKGIDFAGDEGTPIKAIGAGIVLGAGWLYSGYGISVVIDHGDGYLTHYAHLSALNVEEGEAVATDQVIGWEGSTGNSTGPHLHFEVHQGLWNQVDPAAYLRDHGVPADC